MKETIKVVGGGLAGCEAAYQLLKRGYAVDMIEMRPVKGTGAHKTADLAELVCSNSLKSTDEETASGLLKAEMELMDSLLLNLAEEAKVEAGGALAVDRKKFSKLVEEKLNSFENFRLIREEFTDFNNSPTIIATGPLTSDALCEKLKSMSGGFYFFDAIAPIVTDVDMNYAFWGGRYGKGADYLNLPMEKDEYLAFYDALISAETVKLKDFEGAEVFEGCMPIEVMAKRGVDAIRFGPLKPVGLVHPETGKKYYAVVQLRKENLSGDSFNMVGFQTNLTFKEQKRVFSMIPALKNAEFLRLGVMHKNTYVNSPKLLDDGFRVKGDKPIYVAGQLSGVEGYVESMLSGLIAGVNMARELSGKKRIIPPITTISGALCAHTTFQTDNYQPMNSNFGILPFIDCKDKKNRKKEYYKRAMCDIMPFVENLDK
ncbi:MAG: methylenetetrahydrofolate--tRNA-(uracil(54)-C(5))-methyltransferase (FADH(2)-oxidizing) TrmFO [Acidaminococcus sp.]|nr:methylenetetrahydrofolate--tRNA-(uracil(54)-C(5))-methyltransferase (FADH(2)-oxidizing) TrmFO [Acidaminococcus sp.]MDY4559101.1 methylenetetrahydrofolate--tRNA-(uracil(54)-C(5))-methyltransferase (FADH(2)-oxidizing) TrmFO [Eubacteriales bacterium]MDY5345101.1 methylenetetrahydrofolate--tRNA-(uracil(54)-C(5))-methyltransferase (FADH(2)-oxidizing) TrmFO [Eubacteriales bacterium]